jgi:3-deoxy-D-manno-octulosonic-acid transferase
VLSPVIALYLLYRGLRDRRYFHGLGERLGFLPRSLQSTGGGSIWLHAVSVGEIMSAIELLRQLREDQRSVSLYVSTTTLAGRAMAEEKLKGLVDGVFYAPLDYRSIVRRVLRRLRPSMVVILETEIWPNLYREAKRSGAALLVLNGRISDRALPRYKKYSWFFGAALQWPNAIFVQTEEDARRYILAGAPPQSVRVGGNLKYDFNPSAKSVAPEVLSFLENHSSRKVWIAASTMAPAVSGDPDEDDVVIEAHRTVLSRNQNVLLILVPRKPERFDSTAEKLSAAGMSYVRRSAFAADANASANPGANVLLLDSIGELAALMAHADVVFMGGTLASRGGHNILEPAFFGKPVIIGPHMENFAATAEEFQKAQAVRRIEKPAQLAGAVFELLTNPGEIGARAKTVAESKRGVKDRLAAEIWHAYGDGISNPMATLPARIFLHPLCQVWLLGHRINTARNLAKRKTLRTPVISVGGMAMGGVGKSPLVAHLAHRFREAGKHPAILTRGYMRREPGQSVVVVARGHNASVLLTGDEAQIFIRRGDAHVGVSQDRYEAGLHIEEELAPDVFILDDGFQHVRLGRKYDLVLIDALNPLAGGIFPVGRLREPFSALARATIVMITRVDPGRETTAIERLVRRYNPTAPIFRSRAIPQQWVELATNAPLAGSVRSPGFRKVAAFCGLGNPAAFWKTLEDLGFEIVYRWAFGDHHPYKPLELQRLAEQSQRAGAEAIVTTEKDMINLCERASQVLVPMKLYWLKIGMEIENEEELLRVLQW